MWLLPALVQVLLVKMVILTVANNRYEGEAIVQTARASIDGGTVDSHFFARIGRKWEKENGWTDGAVATSLNTHRSSSLAFPLHLFRALQYSLGCSELEYRWPFATDHVGRAWRDASVSYQ